MYQEGPWSDVNMGALYNYNGVETEASALFKNQFGRLEGSAKINLPIDGFRYYIL